MFPTLTAPARPTWLPLSIVVVTMLGMVATMLALTTSRADAASSYDDAIDITFPVNSHTGYVDDFYHGRSSDRTHQATDIMTVYGEPVFAAMGGTISFITGLDGNPPWYGYMIRVSGDDGRDYVYIHLGSQSGSPNEAYASGMKRGVRVERGQHIGYSGHSGNASESAPHLHFEIHDPSITNPLREHRMNPYASLVDAERRGDTPEAWRKSSCNGEAYAFAGDWDRSGTDGQGWWCDGRVRLRTSSGQIMAYTYGRPGDIPMVADWNGNGQDTVSIVRDGTWHINERLSGGDSQRTFTYGRVTRGDVPIAGDWNGDGTDTIGIIRDGEWHLRHDQRGGPGEVVFTYGRITRGDLALIGDWNGDGADKIGIVREREWHLRDSLAGGPADTSYIYGRVLRGDTPVMGDWTGNGVTTPGIVRDGEWHLRNVHEGGNADQRVFFPAP